MAGLSKKIIKKEEREEKEKRGWEGVATPNIVHRKIEKCINFTHLTPNITHIS